MVDKGGRRTEPYRGGNGVVEKSTFVNECRKIDVIDKQAFGRWLRELRQQRGITQGELARLALAVAL